MTATSSAGSIRSFSAVAGARVAKTLAAVRRALSSAKKLEIVYQSEQGERTERTVRPLGAFFWGRFWTLAAYCELRQDFRNFRLDRVERIDLSGAPIPEEPAVRCATILPASARTRSR